MKSLIRKIAEIRAHRFSQEALGMIVFLGAGIASTAWFLIRVIPKPQRATYPCMRAASPLMATFVIYLLGLTGTWAAYRKARLAFLNGKYVLGTVCLALLLCVGLSFFGVDPSGVFAAPAVPARMTLKPNEPLGEATGIHPGRVVWVHDPKAATWDGKTGMWWDNASTPQAEADKMVNQALVSLTGQSNLTGAWDALFLDFNKTRRARVQGYKAGEKIAVKLNVNNTSSQASNDQINASPQVTLALLRTLVRDAGIPQENITVFDASRFITDNIFDPCHKEFPGVIFVDNVGGNGRVKSQYVKNAIPYSANNGKLAQGLATCATEADYLINVALLKGHGGTGVTLCGKNYYGVTSIDSDWKKNFHNNFNQDKEGKPKYLTFVDFMGHKDLGGKTMLYLIDGLYAQKYVAGRPGPKWKSAPFNGNWPCSLFASQDGVAIDSVGLDFFFAEFPDAPEMAYSDQYLIEAALANNPPSKTVYDPERDGTPCKSLGVVEHWNNSAEKKYSRNLGGKSGIELVQDVIQ